MTKTMADNFRMFIRNDRWGTCGWCPRDSEGNTYPEFCKDTNRYDHCLSIDQLSDSYRVSML